jgi:hypothetical protein
MKTKSHQAKLRQRCRKHSAIKAADLVVNLRVNRRRQLLRCSAKAQTNQINKL